MTCLGSNILLRNEGDGTFADVTAAAGVDDPRWSTGAAFLDFDLDGRLDLFVQNYVDWTVEQHRPCFTGGKLVYCTPDQFEGNARVALPQPRGREVRGRLGRRPGSRRRRARASGSASRTSTGTAWPDIYCANDTTANFLFHNLGTARFEEVGAVCRAPGTARTARKKPGMGVDAADYDGDGRPDLVVTNFQGETNSLLPERRQARYSPRFRALPAPRRRASPGSGSASDGSTTTPTAWWTWSSRTAHVYDNGPELDPPVPSAQPPTLYRNTGGGRFADVTDRSGKRFGAPDDGPRPRHARISTTTETWTSSSPRTEDRRRSSRTSAATRTPGSP